MRSFPQRRLLVSFSFLCSLASNAKNLHTALSLLSFYQNLWQKLKNLKRSAEMAAFVNEGRLNCEHSMCVSTHCWRASWDRWGAFGYWLYAVHVLEPTNQTVSLQADCKVVQAAKAEPACIPVLRNCCTWMYSMLSIVFIYLFIYLLNKLEYYSEQVKNVKTRKKDILKCLQAKL